MLAALLVIANRPLAVTLDVPCVQSSVALAELGRQAGLDIRPTGSVIGDYFAVKLTDVPIDDALRVVAETLEAEWLQKEEILYLTRSSALDAEAKKRSDDELRKQIQQFLERRPETALDSDVIKRAMADIQTSKGIRSVQESAYQQLQSQNPEQRLGAAVVRALGVESFVRMKEGDKTRYYLLSDGTSTMPNALKSAIMGLQQERELYDIAMTSVGNVAQYASSGQIGQSNFGLTVSYERNTISVRLSQTTARQDSMQYTNSTTLVSFYRRRSSSRFGRSASIPKLKGKFELSENVQSLIKILARDNSSTTADRLRAIKSFSNMAQNEPLALVASAPLHAMAVETKRDYVALLPDAMIERVNWAGGAGSGLLANVWPSWAYGVFIGEDSKTKILTIKPTDPEAARDYRLSRAGISRFVSDASRTGHMTLDAAATLAGFTSSRDEFARHWFFAANVVSGRTQPPDYLPLKVFGSLSPVQKRNARSGGVVLPFSALGRDVKAILGDHLTSESAMYGSQLNENVNWMNAGSSYMGTLKTGVLAITGNLPSSAIVRVTVLTNTLLTAQPSEENRDYEVLLSASQIAAMQRQQRNRWTPDYSKARVTSIERLHVDVMVPNVGYTQLVTQITDSGPNDKYVKLEDLPEPWKSQVAEAMKRGG